MGMVWRAVLNGRRPLHVAALLLGLLAPGCVTGDGGLKGKYDEEIITWSAKRVPYEPSPVSARVDEMADQLVAAASERQETKKLVEQCRWILTRPSPLEVTLLIKSPGKPTAKRKLDVVPYARFGAYAVLWKLDRLPPAESPRSEDVTVEIARIEPSKRLGDRLYLPVKLRIQNRSKLRRVLPPLAYVMVRAAGKTLMETNLATLDLMNRRGKKPPDKLDGLKPGASRTLQLDCALPQKGARVTATVCYWQYPVPNAVWVGCATSQAVDPPADRALVGSPGRRKPVRP